MTTAERQTTRAAHTPGPWRVEVAGKAGLTVPALVRGERLRILVDHAEDFGDPTPDARLIAAAPDLLEALTGLLADIESVMDAVGKRLGTASQGVIRDDVAICRAAIAKATGQ